MNKTGLTIALSLAAASMLASNPAHAGGGALYRYWSASAPGLIVADFTGDGISDVFLATGSNWYLSESGTGNWSRINTHNETIDELGFGDFDGDGETDVFYADGSTWEVSYSGTGSWDTLNSGSAGQVDLLSFRRNYAYGWTTYNEVPDLFFEDFDGDGETDVFYADGSSWYISWSGTTSFDKVNTSGFRPYDSVGSKSLDFGDFDGDGEMDVFRPGSQWYVSYSATSAWDDTDLAGSGAAMYQLDIADVNGDGVSDVLRLEGNGSRWQVSDGGQGSWSTLISGRNEGVDDVAWGFFNSNATADAMRTTGSQWQVSYAGQNSWSYLNTSGYQL